MPRVTSVAKAQKPQGTCGKCGEKIEKGQPYKWWAFRYGGRRVRCMKPKCSPRASDLTQSKASGVYAAQEAVEDAIAVFRTDGDLDALKGAMEDAAGEIRAVGDEYKESASNIESGFNHSTSMSDELNEKGEALDSTACDLEGAAGQLEDFQEEEPSKASKLHDEWATMRESWIEEQANQAEDAASNIEAP